MHGLETIRKLNQAKAIESSERIATTYGQTIDVIAGTQSNDVLVLVSHYDVIVIPFSDLDKVIEAMKEVRSAVQAQEEGTGAEPVQDEGAVPVQHRV